MTIEETTAEDETVETPTLFDRACLAWFELNRRRAQGLEPAMAFLAELPPDVRREMKRCNQDLLVDARSNALLIDRSFGAANIQYDVDRLEKALGEAFVELDRLRRELIESRWLTSQFTGVCDYLSDKCDQLAESQASAVAVE